MKLIDEEGLFFGKINIIDASVIVFLLLLATMFIVYTFTPPLVHETHEIYFQVYVTPTLVGDNTLPMIKDVFSLERQLVTNVPGENAVISDALTLKTTNPRLFDILLTIRANVSMNSDGNYLFNGYQIETGNSLPIQVGNITFLGLVHRFNVTTTSKQALITILLFQQEIPLNTGDTIVKTHLNGTTIAAGKIVTVNRDDEGTFLTISLTADTTGTDLYFNEQPLLLAKDILLFTESESFSGKIVVVSP